jgi:hypothetical protein
MKKYIFLWLSMLALFLLSACAVVTPKKEFYDSKIKTIEVNIAKREHKYKDQERSDKFVNQIIVELNNKGYIANLGNKNLPPFIGDLPSSLDDYAKEIAPKLGTDAIIFLDCKFLRQGNNLITRGEGEESEITPTDMLAFFQLYNENGDRLLQWGDMCNMKYGDETFYIDSNNKVFMLSDDFFIDNMAKKLLLSLPPYGMNKQQWDNILNQRKSKNK